MHLLIFSLLTFQQSLQWKFKLHKIETFMADFYLIHPISEHSPFPMESAYKAPFKLAWRTLGLSVCLRRVPFVYSQMYCTHYCDPYSTYSDEIWMQKEKELRFICKLKDFDFMKVTHWNRIASIIRCGKDEYKVLRKSHKSLQSFYMVFVYKCFLKLTSP